MKFNWFSIYLIWLFGVLVSVEDEGAMATLLPLKKNLFEVTKTSAQKYSSFLRYLKKETAWNPLDPGETFPLESLGLFWWHGILENKNPLS